MHVSREKVRLPTSEKPGKLPMDKRRVQIETPSDVRELTQQNKVHGEKVQKVQLQVEQSGKTMH
jgi:hypothetical protein